MIIGLSGTGKTTTTFTTQNDSLPVQDDFVALMPGGKPYGTENGCFAKTFSLDPDFEPNIYNAVVKPTTYLENVYQDEARQGELLRAELHAERARGVPDGRPRAVPRRDGGRHRRLPVDPQPEREHHPRGRQARPGAGGRVLHARRDHRDLGGRRLGGRQVPPGPRHEPVLPAPPRAPGQSDPRAARDASDRDLPAEHGTGRRWGRGRALEEGEDPAHLGLREGHRRADDLVDAGRGLRLPGRRRRAGLRRRRAPAAAPAVRARGPPAGVPRDRGSPEGANASRISRGSPSSRPRS